MIIRYASDLHLDHIYYRDYQACDTTLLVPETEYDSESILVLAGDVSNGRFGHVYIRQLCKRFKYVIFVMGNHEFYSNDINKAVRKYRDRMKGSENFILLDNEVFALDEYKINFIGSTLWTDFANSKEAMALSKQKINDYHCIRNYSGGNYHDLLTPEDTKALHHEAVRFIDNALTKLDDSEYTNIVITHHLPHMASVNNKFLGDALSPAYCSNLDWLFEKHPSIRYWIHGHTHDYVKEKVYNSTILCDPNGYPSQHNNFRGLSYIEA